MATRKIRNPKFKEESYKQLSWTRVVLNQFPYDHTTSCCEKRTKVGDIVITVPVFVRGEMVGTGIMHSRCLLPFLKKVPDDMTLVKQKVSEIRKTFVR